MKVAAVQLSVGPKLEDNLARAGALIDSAAEQGAGLVALPECFTGKYGVQFFASYREKLPSAASADTSTGASMMAERAQKHKIFVTGGVIEEAQDGKIYNSMPVYGPDGRLVANYRKVHLSRYCRRILQRPVLLCAESELESARVMGVTSESDVLESGHVTTTVAIGQTAGGVDSEGAPLLMGMACCFDLRFPVFLAQYGPRIDKPVHCICAPSAFLDLTGKQHWDLLIRRTALDGQCYVIAPDIAFEPSDSTPLHGRAAIVGNKNPFGVVLAQCPAEGDALAIAEVTADRVTEIRNKLPLTLWAQ